VILFAADRVESIKLKTPTFSYEGNTVSFTIGAKNFVSLTFHKGADIQRDHPRLAGDGKQVRTMRFDDREDPADNRGGSGSRHQGMVRLQVVVGSCWSWIRNTVIA